MALLKGRKINSVSSKQLIFLHNQKNMQQTVAYQSLEPNEQKKTGKTLPIQIMINNSNGGRTDQRWFLI